MCAHAAAGPEVDRDQLAVVVHVKNGGAVTLDLSGRAVFGIGTGIVVDEIVAHLAPVARAVILVAKKLVGFGNRDLIAGMRGENNINSRRSIIRILVIQIVLIDSVGAELLPNGDTVGGGSGDPLRVNLGFLVERAAEDETVGERFFLVPAAEGITDTDGSCGSSGALAVGIEDGGGIGSGGCVFILIDIVIENEPVTAVQVRIEGKVGAQIVAGAVLIDRSDIILVKRIIAHDFDIIIDDPAGEVLTALEPDVGPVDLDALGVVAGMDMVALGHKDRACLIMIDNVADVIDLRVIGQSVGSTFGIVIVKDIPVDIGNAQTGGPLGDRGIRGPALEGLRGRDIRHAGVEDRIDDVVFIVGPADLAHADRLNVDDGSIGGVPEIDSKHICAGTAADESVNREFIGLEGYGAAAEVVILDDLHFDGTELIGAALEMDEIEIVDHRDQIVLEGDGNGGLRLDFVLALIEEVDVESGINPATLRRSGVERSLNIAQIVDRSNIESGVRGQRAFGCVNIDRCSVVGIIGHGLRRIAGLRIGTGEEDIPPAIEPAAEHGGTVVVDDSRKSRLRQDGKRHEQHQHNGKDLC